MIYVEMHHKEPEYISAYVEEGGEVLFSGKFEPDEDGEAFIPLAMQLAGVLPTLLRAAHDAGYQAALDGMPPGGGFHLEHIYEGGGFILENIDDRGEGIGF